MLLGAKERRRISPCSASGGSQQAINATSPTPAQPRRWMLPIGTIMAMDTFSNAQALRRPRAACRRRPPARAARRSRVRVCAASAPSALRMAYSRRRARHVTDHARFRTALGDQREPLRGSSVPGRCAVPTTSPPRSVPSSDVEGHRRSSISRRESHMNRSIIGHRGPSVRDQRHRYRHLRPFASDVIDHPARQGDRASPPDVIRPRRRFAARGHGVGIRSPKGRRASIVDQITGAHRRHLSSKARPRRIGMRSVSNTPRHVAEVDARRSSACAADLRVDRLLVHPQFWSGATA